MHYLIIAVLAFALSTLGCEGKTGPAGPTGSGGAAGPAGPAGPQGSTGPQGPAGADGATGPQGPAGADGKDGAPGADGADGADGETGPAGPAGPAGAAGADGADGADGETGPAGPQGPKGDKGDKGDTGPAGPAGDDAVGSTVHHIALAFGEDPDDEDYMSEGIDDDAAMRILRKGEMLEVHAVARAQNGEVIEDVMFDWEVGTDADTVDDNPSDDTMSNMVEAKVVGTTTITVTAIDHNIAAELDIEVTAKVGSIALKTGAPATDFKPKASYFPDDTTDVITAIPNVKYRHDKDNVVWSSDDSDVAKVIKASDNESDHHAKNTITAVAAGTATITAEYEGKKATFKVVVSGSRDDRSLTYVINVDEPATFTFLLARTGANPRNASGPGADDAFVLEAILEDEDGDPLMNKWVYAALDVREVPANTPVITGVGDGDAVAKSTNATGVLTASVRTGMDGTAEFTIAPPTTPPTAKVETDYTITLTSAGANSQTVKIVVEARE